MTISQWGNLKKSFAPQGQGNYKEVEKHYLNSG